MSALLIHSGNASRRRRGSTLASIVVLIAVLAAGWLYLHGWSAGHMAELARERAQENADKVAEQQTSTPAPESGAEDESAGDEDDVTGTSNQEQQPQSLFSEKSPPPPWVAKGDYFDTPTQTQFLVVASEPHLASRDAETELEEQLVTAVRDHVDKRFGEGAGKAIGIDLDYIRENLIQEHEECLPGGIYHHELQWRVPEDSRIMLESDVREAYQCFAQVKLDPEFERWAEGRWENRLVISRTMQTGLIALATVVFLTLVFGYFTAEHKTRGFYSRRLQTAGLACLAIAGLAFWWLATQFAWL